VQHTPDDELLQVDVEAWSAALADAYAVHAAEVKADEWWGSRRGAG
jgi:hypothetical protein